MLNVAVVHEKSRQNTCLRAHQGVSPSSDDLLRLVECIVLITHVVESRDQSVVHTGLHSTVVEEEVGRVVNALVQALAFGYCR